MTGNPQVITSLQAAAASEARLAMQYALDKRSLRFIGVKKTNAGSYSDDAHCYFKKVTKRILLLGGDPSYTIGDIKEQDTVTDLYANELAMEMAIVTPYEQAVQTAMKALDDTTRNLFEHLLKWHQQHVAWLEQQLRLIKTLGENEYIAEMM